MLNTTEISQFKSLKIVLFTLMFFPIFLHAQNQNRPPPEGFSIDYVSGLDSVTISWAHLPEVQNCEYVRVNYSLNQVEQNYPLKKYSYESCNAGQLTIKNLSAGNYFFWATQEWLEEICEYDDTDEEEICEDVDFDSGYTQPKTMLILPNVKSNANFETDFDGFTNTGPFTWSRRSGQTPSGSTGPNIAGEGSFYVYMETSNGSAYHNGNEAILESSTLNASDTYNLSFMYNMYGADIGTLYVETLQPNGIWTVIWQQSGQQTGPFFTETSLNISNAQKFRFRGRAVGGYRGDMALDKIKVMNLTNVNKRVRFIHTDILGSPITESDENGNEVN